MALEDTDTTDVEQPDEKPRRPFDRPSPMPAEAQPEVPPPRPGQQGDPNAPGGPPPDPSSFRLSPTNPARPFKLAEATPLNPTATDAFNTRPFGASIYRPPPGGGPSEWGKDWWPTKTAQSYPGVVTGDPNNPNPQESYPLSVTSGAKLAKYAPPDVAQPVMQGNFLMNPIAAIADAFSKGRFSHNFSEAYLRGLAIQREEALQHYERGIANYREHMLTYGKILSEAGVSKDPQRFERAKQQIIEYATGRDPDILRIMEHGDLKAVETHLNNQNALMRQLEASTTSLRKATTEREREEAAESQSLGLPHAPGGVASGMHFLEGEEAGAAQAPQGARTPTAAESAPQTRFDAYASKQSPLYTPQVLDLARKSLLGTKPNLMPHSPGARAVEQAERFLSNELARVGSYQEPANSGRTDEEVGQEKQDTINEIVPGLGNKIDDLHKLRVDPAAIPMRGDERFNLVDLTARTWKGWNQGMYHAYQTIWNNDKSNEWKGLRAINRAGNELKVFMAAINHLPGGEDDRIPSYVMTGLKQKLWTGEADYAALNEPLRTLATDTVVINNMGGRAAVTPVNQLLREAPIYGSKRQLRMLGVQIAKQLDQIRENTYDVYHRQTGLSGDPPPSDPVAGELIGYVARSNANTGKFEKDAPIELKSIEPKTHAKDLTKDQTWEPMSREQYESRRRGIERMRKEDPTNPKIQLYEHELGIVQ